MCVCVCAVDFVCWEGYWGFGHSSRTIQEADVRVISGGGAFRPCWWILGDAAAYADAQVFWMVYCMTITVVISLGMKIEGRRSRDAELENGCIDGHRQKMQIRLVLCSLDADFRELQDTSIVACQRWG